MKLTLKDREVPVPIMLLWEEIGLEHIECFGLMMTSGEVPTFTIEIDPPEVATPLRESIYGLFSSVAHPSQNGGAEQWTDEDLGLRVFHPDDDVFDEITGELRGFQVIDSGSIH